MELFLIEIIAEKAKISKQMMVVKLKQMEVLNGQRIIGKVMDLTDRYMLLQVDRTFERVVFLDWIDFIEPLEMI